MYRPVCRTRVVGREGGVSVFADSICSVLRLTQAYAGRLNQNETSHSKNSFITPCVMSHSSSRSGIEVKHRELPRKTHPCSQSLNTVREPVLPQKICCPKTFLFFVKVFFLSLNTCFISGAIRLDLLHLYRWSICSGRERERERELSKYHRSSWEYVVWTLPKTNKAKRKGSFWVLLTLGLTLTIRSGQKLDC